MTVVRRIGSIDRRMHLAVAVVLGLTLTAVLTGALGQIIALLTGDREHIRDALAGLGVAAPFASIGLNVLQGVIAPIPGFVVPYIDGMVFGTWAGMLITWIGGIAAASACFGISRSFGRGIAERVCGRFGVLERANHTLERHGLGAIILARSVPGMPFDAFSYLAGLSRVGYRRFALGTAIGSAPHALAYSLMGSHLSVPLWVGLALTPLIGLVVAAIHCGARRIRRPGAGASPRPLPRGVAAGAATGRSCTTRATVRASGCAVRAPKPPAAWGTLHTAARRSPRPAHTIATPAQRGCVGAASMRS